MFIRIEPSSSVPIYKQIEEQLRRQIASGHLRSGDKLPAVRQLAKEIAVNQNTILKVYNQLTREGLFEVVKGSGTFVSNSALGISGEETCREIFQEINQLAQLCVQFGIDCEQAVVAFKKEYCKVQENNSEV